MYDTAEYKEFAQQGINVGIGLNSSSRLSFLSDYEIVVELTGAVEVGDNFMLIDGETAGAIAVALSLAAFIAAILSAMYF